MKKIRNRLTYANVMSSLAVFLVLGGATAFAATKIGSNEIKANAILTGKIKKEAVTTSKIKNAAINNAKLADGSVSNAKLADGSVTENKIAAGAITTSKLSASAQPTPVASLRVTSTGALVSASPGVDVVKGGGSFYCVKLPFAASGGAVSTTGNAEAGSHAQVSVPADANCNPFPGFDGAAVYTTDSDGALEPKNWTGIFR